MIEWIEEHGLEIKNRSTSGDEEGDTYTYIGAIGCIVIDYMIKRGKNWEDKLEVKEMRGSDHLPIIYR